VATNYGALLAGAVVFLGYSKIHRYRLMTIGGLENSTALSFNGFTVRAIVSLRARAITSERCS